MKSIIFFSIVVLYAVSSLGDTYKFEPIPIKGPDEGLKICKIVDQGFAKDAKSQLKSIQLDIGCGSYEEALEKISYLYAIVEDEAVMSSGQGVCYSVRGCVEPNRLLNSLKSKSACWAAGGKSWKQTKPTAGACKRL